MNSMQRVEMLSVAIKLIMLSFIMLNVVMLSVVVPFYSDLLGHKADNLYT